MDQHKENKAGNRVAEKTAKKEEVTNMAVKMRLRRMGQKKAPFYRVIVADARAPRDGRFIDEIGIYDPTKEPSVIKIDEEAAKKWLNNGAQPTETVAKLLKIAGIEK
jgi:small subunit ribosomal protein S16